MINNRTQAEPMFLSNDTVGAAGGPGTDVTYYQGLARDVAIQRLKAPEGGLLRAFLELKLKQIHKKAGM